jgi:hypothetical protein
VIQISWKAWLGVAAFLTVLWGATFWPVLAQHQNLMGYSRLDPRITGAPLNLAHEAGSRWPARGDFSLHMTFLPYKAFLSSELHRGVFPLWNPRIACGQPVASDPQYQPFSPFFWPYLAWPSAWTFSLGVVLMALFGMIGFSLYFRELGWSWPAVTLGGALLAWNPLTSQMLVLSSPWALWTFSWALWGAERWINGRRLGMPICLAGAAGVIFMGHPVIGTLYLCILGAYIALFSKSWSIGRRAVSGLAAAAGVAALAAVVIFPFLAEFSQYSTHKANWHGDYYNSWWYLSDPGSTVYIPMPVLALALVGAFIKGDRRRWFFIALGAYGFLTMVPWFTSGGVRWVFSLGGNLVAMYGQEALWLGAGWLAVRGMQVLIEGTESMYPLSLRCLLYGAGGHYVLAWLSSEYAFQRFFPVGFPGLALVELSCLGCLVALYAIHGTVLRNVVLGGSVLTLATVPWFLPLGPSVLFTTADLNMDPPEVVRTILAEGGGTGRWRMTGEYQNRRDGRPDLIPNQPEEWGLWDIRTTNPLILTNYAEFSLPWHQGFPFLERWFPRQSDELLRFLGVRWVVQDSVRPESPGFGQTKPSSLTVRDMDGTAPWVRALGCWEAVTSPERQMSETFRLIESGDWRSRVVLDRPVTLIPKDGVGWIPPEIQWEESGPNRWGWRVSGTSPSLLVILQNAHPNWSASLDLEKASILKAYGTFQAVEIPAGDHFVEMSYDEPWFWRGAAVSATAWVGLLLTVVFGLQRRRGRLAD